jgi:O-antigen/teichoic acid export membrane protein
MKDHENPAMNVEMHPKSDIDSRTILRRFSYLLSANWVRDGLQTIFIVYLARKSSTTYGQFMLALSLGQILLFVSEFGINQHLVSLLVRKESDAAQILVRVAALKVGLLSLGWFGIVGFLFWQGYPNELKAVILVLGSGVGIEALASSFYVSYQVRGRQDLESRVRVFSTVLGFSYGVVTVLLGSSPVVVAFYKLIENFSNLTGMIILARKTMRLRFQWPRLREIWDVGRTSLDFTLMAIAAIVYNKANIFFLQRFAGAEGVAQYSATWQIVDWISCLVSNLLLRNVLFPLFSNLWGEDRENFGRVARDSASWLLVAAFPIMFILFSESDRLIPLIYGPGYTSAIWMQKILVVTILIGFLHNLAAYMMMSMKKERLLLIFYLVGLTFGLICCATLIPAAPLMGTVLAIVFTKTLVALMTVSYCQRRLRMIPAQPLLQLCLAIAVGAGLYFLSQGSLPREVVEVATIAPVLVLAWHWRHRLSSKQTPPTVIGAPRPSNFWK